VVKPREDPELQLEVEKRAKEQENKEAEEARQREKEQSRAGRSDLLYYGFFLFVCFFAYQFR